MPDRLLAARPRVILRAVTVKRLSPVEPPPGDELASAWAEIRQARTEIRKMRVQFEEMRERLEALEEIERARAAEAAPRLSLVREQIEDRHFCAARSGGNRPSVYQESIAYVDPACQSWIHRYIIRRGGAGRSLLVRGRGLTAIGTSILRAGPIL